MKAALRHGVRRLADLPLIGRLVRILVAAIRMPEFRAGYFERLRWQEGFEARLEARLEALEAGTALDERSQRVAVFVSDQLPALLAKLSELNDRQLRHDGAQENLTRSVPVALRKLAREVQALRERTDPLDTLGGRLDSTGTALHATQQRLEEILAWRPTADTALDDARRRLASLSESVGYLLGRVEFVRRELLFEMRYGGSAPRPGASTEVEAKVVAPEKLARARERGDLRLNLGCGHVPLDGYLNVDRRELPGVDIVAEIDRLPIVPGEAREIFSAHVLEHFPQEQLRRELLPYFMRLLAPGGTLRAVVPDAEAMLREHSQGRYPYDDLREVIYGGQDYDGDFHYNMFTPDALAALLVEAGFEAVGVPVRGRVNGRSYEFEISAVKPGEG